jgi:hypothetical protein
VVEVPGAAKGSAGGRSLHSAVLWPSVAPATVPRAADLTALALASCGLKACGGPEGAAARGRRRAARVSRRDGGG